MAIIDDQGVRVTYGELAELQQRSMSQIGGRKLIVSLCKNTVGSVAGYVAFVNAGIVPILLNAELERELLENLLDILLYL